MKKNICIFLILFAAMFSVEQVSAAKKCEYSDDNISVSITVSKSNIDCTVKEKKATGSIVSEQNKYTVSDFSKNNEITCLNTIYYDLIEGSSYNGIERITYKLDSKGTNKLSIVNDTTINDEEINNTQNNDEDKNNQDTNTSGEDINNNVQINNGLFGNLDSVKCGNTEIPAPIPPIIRTIINLIKIATPLILIIMGMIDMFNAVIANDEKKIKDSQNKFIKRIMAAAVVFLIVTIVQFVVSIVADDSKSVMSCISCMISDASSCIKVNKPIVTPNTGGK